MPENELTNNPEDREDSQMDDTAELPILYPEAERLDKERREKVQKEFLKNREKELRLKIKKAKGLGDIMEALNAGGRKYIADNIVETIKELRKLVKENDSNNIKCTIENILQSKDLFRGEDFDVGDAYLNKKIRNKLIEFIKEELESM